MKTKFLIGCCFFLLACSSQKETKEPESAVKQEVVTATTTTVINSDSIKQLKQSILAMRLDYDKVEPFFKLSDIKQIDSVNVFDKNTFRLLTSNEYYSAFQDTSDYYYDEYNLAYYYSNQGEWNGLRRYIFVKVDEVCCTSYYYNIYDKAGKKVNSFIIASSGGEGGWSIDADFITLNDSTFKQTTVECDYGIDEQSNEIADCDSVITIFSLTGYGQLDKVVESKHTVRK